MDETTKNALNAFLVNALELVQDAGKFAGEQIPIVLQEIIRYAIVAEALTIAVCLCFLTACFFFVKYCYKENTNGRTIAYKCDGVLPWVPTILVGSFSFGFLLASTYQLIFVLVAPRLYLLEYLKDFIN